MERGHKRGKNDAKEWAEGFSVQTMAKKEKAGDLLVAVASFLTKREGITL